MSVLVIVFLCQDNNIDIIELKHNTFFLLNNVYCVKYVFILYDKFNFENSTNSMVVHRVYNYVELCTYHNKISIAKH